jgi:KUP system potassium uptake protein
LLRAVLSAVSGLQVKAGLNSSSVIGITCAILVLLFGIQSWGTQRVGIMFAPTVALWFLSNVLVGTFNICMFEGGSIFRALSPHYIGACIGADLAW